jgi:hypothetical protein
MATDAAGSPQRPPEEELRLVNDELDSLRETVVELRGQIGARTDGTTDPAETAALIESADEQEALIGALEARRDALLRQLT